MIKTIIENMKLARIEQGYSQLDVCSSIGINISTYNRIENGIVHPRPRTAKKICDFLQKPFGTLFEITGHPILANDEAVELFPEVCFPEVV